MFLEIITPDKKIFEGEIKLIQMTGIDGSFEILKNHAPIVSILEKGNIKILDENDKKFFFEIDGGAIEAKNNKIIVLADNF
ncbi:MAG: ATP synthase F1 subunit epsilon [Bacteroidetes bacterium 4572_128]|nr:MAG: ATP synthase F1 subunit epsilon [Bacteroidetes bacterium 4572_128]